MGLIVLIATASSGCVSISIGSGEVERAKDVSFRPPSEPFVRIKAEGADQAWRNSKTSTLISYLSTCGDRTDPSLELIQSELLSAFEKPAVLKTQSFSFNKRAAIRSEAMGLIDGIQTKIDLLVFKKNGCTYSLTYVGQPESFALNQPQFEEFIKSFEVP